MTINVTLLCGGRGSSSLIRALDQNRFINLTLLVNAFDDGLSTGHVRNSIPGMLGPSDFRKNIGTSLSSHRYHDNLLLDLLESRIAPFNSETLKVLSDSSISNFSYINPKFNNLKKAVSRDQIQILNESLQIIIDYFLRLPAKISFEEMSFGNLIFSGIYLKKNKDFNEAINEYANLIGIKSQIYNVSDGVSLTLSALRKSGSYDKCESEIVSKKTLDPIVELYLTDNLSQKQTNPSPRDYTSYASKDARQALLNSDIIIFGSGTLHSSIFPSLMILKSVVKECKPKLKIMIENLDFDNDICGLSRDRIVEQTLKYLDDTHNEHSLDYVISDPSSKIQGTLSESRNIELSILNVRSKVHKDRHNGFLLAQHIIDIYKKRLKKPTKILCILNSRTPKERRDMFINQCKEIIESNQESLGIIFYETDPLCFTQEDIDKIISTNPDFLLYTGQRLNFNLYDLLSGINLALEYRFSNTIVNFVRNSIPQTDIQNLNIKYRSNIFSIKLSRLAANFLNFLIWIKWRQKLMDPLGEMKIMNLDLLHHNNLFKSGTSITKLWLHSLSTNVLILNTPIEYFEVFEKGLIKRKLFNLRDTIRSLI